MPVDLTPFQHTIVCVSSLDGHFHGIGWLCQRDLVITCAHVVADALNYERNIEFTPSESVSLNCPFTDSKRSTAAVIAWFPRNGAQLSDIALLQLAQPLLAEAVPLSHSLSLNGVHFKAWGGPAGHEIDLIDIEGKIGSEMGNGRYRLDVSGSNYKIEPGCSGAPVVDPQTGQVLGLIAQEELDATIAAGFLIPAVQLRQALTQAEIFLDDAGGEHLQPLNNWVKTHYQLRSRDRQRVERFVAHYTGTATEPMPFAGRAQELQRLNAWLAQQQQRLLLLSSAAGRGKSALLLHWLASIINEVTVLFLPISIRFNTSSELDGLRLLHAALCDYFDDLRFPPEAKPNSDDYRDRLFAGWDYIHNRPEQHYVLAVDGIDESVNHWFLDEVLPIEIPVNMHILLSARHQLQHVDGQAWLTDLKIAGEIVELAPLAKPAMAEAIIQLGHPLDQLAERQAFTDQLYRLTDEGDPLLLNLWLSQIWRHRHEAPEFTAEKLQQLAPSFGGFYQLWLEEQQKLWQAQAIQVHPDDFTRLMYVLAWAHGPLLLEGELLDLLAQIDLPVAWDYVKLRDVLTTAQRLVTGDGINQCFVLIHPRLNDYFQAELAQKPPLRRQIQHAYLNWGAQVVERLNNGTLMPDSCPRYLLRHYSEHIAAADLDLTLEKHWLPLLEGGWHQAWEAYEGAWGGFLSDLQQVFEVLQAYNADCYERGERGAMNLAAEVRCALIRASIHTLTQNIPARLVVELVRARMWSLVRAERVAEQFEAEKEIECLMGLAEFSLSRDKFRLLERVLSMAGKIEDERSRAQVLTAVLPQVEGEQRQKLLSQILEMAGKIEYEEERAEVLTAVLLQVEGEQRQKLLQQVLSAWPGLYLEDFMSQIKNESQLLLQVLNVAEEIYAEKICDEEKIDYILYYYAKALITIFSQVNNEQQQKILQQVLSIAAKYLRIKDSDCVEEGTELLIDLISQIESKLWQKSLPQMLNEDKQQQDLLQQVLSITEKIPKERARIGILTRLIVQVEGKQKQELLPQILSMAKQIEDTFDDSSEEFRYETLITILSFFLMPPYEDEQQQELLDQALNIVGELDLSVQISHITTVNIFLMAKVEGEQQQELLWETEKLQEKLNTLEYSGKEWDVEAINILISQLEGEQRYKLLHQALNAIKWINDADWCIEVLNILIPKFEGKHQQELIYQALNIIEQFQSSTEANNIAIAIDMLIPKILEFEGEQRQKLLQWILNIAERVEKKDWRGYIQAGLVPHLKNEQRKKLLLQVLHILNEVDEIRKAPYSARAVLANMISQINDEQRQQEVLEQNDEQRKERLEQNSAIEHIENKEWHSYVFTTVISQSKGRQHQKLLQQALVMCIRIKDEAMCFYTLIELISQIEDKQQALNIAQQITDEEWRTYVLNDIILQAEGERRQELLQQILNAAEQIEDKICRADLLLTLISQYEDERKQKLLQQTLNVAKQIEDKYWCAKLLAILVPHFENEQRQELLQQTLSVAKQIEDKYWCTEILAMLVPHFENEQKQELLQQTLSVAKQIEDKHWCVEHLTKLVPQFEDKQILNVIEQLSTTKTTPDVTQNIKILRVKILTTLISQAEWPQELLRQILNIVEQISERKRNDVLIALLPQVEVEERQGVLSRFLEIRKIEDEWERAKVLTALLPQVEGEQRQKLLPQILEMAGKFEDERSRAKVLTDLIPQVKGEQRQKLLPQILEMAGKIEDEWERAQVLTAVLPQVEGEQRQRLLFQILEMVEEVGKFRNARILTILISEIKENELELQKIIFNQSLSILDGTELITVNAKLVALNPTLLTHDLWSNWLNHTPLERSDLFEITDKLCTAATHLTGNRQQATEIARSVMDVVRWWP